MLRIDRKYVEGVQAATSAEDLHQYVQNAIELEHATIPTYLCAYFTLKLGTNQAVADVIRSIIVQEMLHMTIAANLLIALGGKPQINKPGFIPQYPGPLPMGVGGSLIVPLKQCSIELVHNVFMEIEEPEDPIVFPSVAAVEEGVPEFRTIGEFYKAVSDKITALGPAAFKGDFSHEVIANQWFDKDELFLIDGPESANNAINIIVEQGEGTTTSPLDPEGAPAHYYRFEEIVRGRKLVKDPSVEQGYSFTGAPVVFDAGEVWNMDSNPKAESYPAGSKSRRRADQFNYSYTMLLNALHLAFNGKPDKLNEAMGVMFELRLLAQQVLQTPVPDKDVQTGLCFQYAPINS